MINVYKNLMKNNILFFEGKNNILLVGLSEDFNSITLTEVKNTIAKVGWALWGFHPLKVIVFSWKLFLDRKPEKAHERVTLVVDTSICIICGLHLKSMCGRMIYTLFYKRVWV